jgi:FkbM family methyltransferase
VVQLRTVARNSYQRTLNREWWKVREARRAMFGQFVEPGSLVFDIGANRGDYAEMFVELGCRVVAVEPNPALAATIRLDGVTVEGCAVGDSAGVTVLAVGIDDEHSSINPEWVARNKERWRDKITVAIRTLDDLIAEHGTPAFVKIDVEGNEAHVLAGLSHPLRALSFEALADYSDATSACAAMLTGYRFRCELPDHQLTGWMDADGLDAHIAAAPSDSSFDVFARRSP